MTDRHLKRFAELVEESATVASTKRTHPTAMGRSTYEAVDRYMLLGWSVKVRNLLSLACGKESEHYVAFVAAGEQQSFEENTAQLGRMRAVLLAAQEDVQGGYLATLRQLAQAEVFSEELDQAKELLSAGYALPAAVIGRVVLETNLKTICVGLGLQTGKLERMNADLTKAGRYSVLVQKRITALAAIGNAAAHGDHAAFSAADVHAMLNDVERLVTDLLS